MILGRERPHLRLLVQWVADAEGSDSRQERVEELVPDRFVQEDPGSGDARLALIVERGEERSLNGSVQIRVVEDDVRAFPPELQKRSLQVRCGLPHDLLADLDGTGEADLVDPGMAREGRPGDRALSRDNVHGPGREPGLLREPRDFERAQRRVLCWLQDYGVPR